MTSKSTNSTNAGRAALSLVAVVTGVAPFLADWNETHIYNEKWPPHAKFHNAQTLSMGALLSGASLFFTWRRTGGVNANLAPAVGFLSMYWVSQAMAFAFPGVAWTDPHLLKPGQSLEQFPQQVPLEIAMLGITAAGASLVLAGTRGELSRSSAS